VLARQLEVGRRLAGLRMLDCPAFKHHPFVADLDALLGGGLMNVSGVDRLVDPGTVLDPADFPRPGSQAGVRLALQAAVADLAQRLAGSQNGHFSYHDGCQFPLAAPLFRRQPLEHFGLNQGCHRST
jgi:hypothetical protein